MSSPLPTWLQHWLGLESAGGGNDLAWGVQHSWPWPSWFTLIFVVTVAAFVSFVYSREPGSARRFTRIVLAGLRLSCICLVLFMLAQWMLTLTRTGLPSLVIMIDDSASMATADHYDDAALQSEFAARARKSGFDGPTRFNLAKTLLTEDNAKLLEDLARHYKLKVYFVSEVARPQSGTSTAELVAAIKEAQPSGATTKLGDGLRTVLADLRSIPPAAVILLTDGVTTDGETLAEAAAQARRKNVSLFTIGLGSEKPVRDVQLADLLVDDVVFVNDLISFDFKLMARGMEGRQVNVALKDKKTKQTLAMQQVTLAADSKPQPARLPYRPTTTGEFEFSVEVENLPEEANPDNNAQSRSVSVREEKFRVLLVQAYPNYEFRYLKELLKRDSTVQLDYVLQDADVDFSEVDKQGRPMALATFPLRREDLFAYDVVIFGDVNPSLLGAAALQNLADFVTEKGGGLVLIAGPMFMPAQFAGTALAPLIPFEPSATVVPNPADIIAEGFEIKPTELGLASPQMQLGDTQADSEKIWRDLSPVYFLVEPGPLKPAARVLATHLTRIGLGGKPTPVFIMQYVGAGRVLFHGTDDTWRWRFQVGDVYFARYWKQTIRALSRAKLVGKDAGAKLTTDRNRFERGQSVRLQLRFLDERLAPVADDGVKAMLECRKHPRQEISLHRSGGYRGLFEATLTGLPEGSYHAWITDPALAGETAADFQVLPPPGETNRLELDAAELRRAAADTRGHYYSFATASRLLEDLGPGQRVPVQHLPPVPLWNWWPVLVLFLMLLISEWLLRKRVGMI
jgi:hypothetical protein